MLLQANILANVILQNYFHETRCLLIFSSNNSFNYVGNLPTVKFANLDDDAVLNYFGCQGIVLALTENPVGFFEKLEFQIQHNLPRYNKRRYLILGNSYEVLDILESRAVEYVADLLIVLNTETERDIWRIEKTAKFDLYTHRFVGPEPNVKVLMDRWESVTGFQTGSNLYPDKLVNCLGRNWTIATFSYTPYSVPAAREGTELKLALEFANHMNLTSILLVDEEGEWGEIYDNWTGYGILGNVMYDNADVGLGALYTWAHEYLFLDLSKPAVRTGITCIAPKPSLAGGWLVPFFPFGKDMWIAVGLSFLVCSITLFILDLYKARAKLYQQNGKRRLDGSEILTSSILSTSGVFLLQSLPEKEQVKKGFGKYLYACMFIFSLLAASSYSSGLASSMTVPRYIGAIKTVQDLVDSKIQWGATSIAWIMSIMGAPEYNYVTLVERFVKTDATHLEEMNNKRFAFSVERLPAGYYAIGDYVTEKGVADLRLMSEDLYWENCVLMTRKSSIWMPYLDDYILRVAQTGIQQVWEFRVATTFLNVKVLKAVKFSSQHEEHNTQPIQLRWNHVEGTFGIWGILMFVSIVVFLIEILVHVYVERNQRIHQE